MIKVYIAGPYTHGDVAVNVRNAIEAGMAVADAGMCPFIPHLSHFAHLLFPHDYEFWMELDEEWIADCDCMLVLPGHSPGTQREVKTAAAMGIPVFQNLTSLLSWASGDV